MVAAGKTKDILIGVVGFGYWGPNIVRNFNSIDTVQVTAVCDKDTAGLKRVRQLYPEIAATTNYEEMLSKQPLDMVAIVTPVYTHYELAKLALEHGKHIFVEKPFTALVSQAEDLIEIAEKKDLKIFVDHTFLFTGAVRKIKEFIDSGVLGNLYYYDSMRVNLGLFQHDVNVIWDLAPHDLSIMDYLLDEEPQAISASGKVHFNTGLEDIAFITAYFSNNLIAHFNVNWMSPVKIRTTLIGGEKKMLVWNDLDADEKLKVYDKGVEVQNTHGIYDLLVSYRSGDMWAPRLEQTEALKTEAEYVINCILHDEKPINDGHAGLRIVKMLEASNRSISNNGELIEL